MFTVKLPAALISSRVDECSLTQMSSIRGSSDSDVTALAVRPCGWPSLPMTVMIVTPLANDPITRRNRPFSIGKRFFLVLISRFAFRPLVVLLSHYSVSDSAYAFDFALHHIAGPEIFGRSAGHADAGGCSGGDNIAR